MIKLKNLLKNNNLRVTSYKKIDSVVKIDTSNGSFVIKKGINNSDIFNYLITRNFNCYPDIINQDDRYYITKYIDNINIPDEQKMNDLIKLVALLHSKTSFYKELNDSEFKKLYEDLSNNILYLKEYYNDLITIIDSKVYMSPPEYLLARNISVLFSSLNYCEQKLEYWYKIISNNDKYRVAVIHNNLDLSHFIKNSNDYLVSWDKSKIDIPLFDLYKLYNNHALDFEFSDIFKIYESIYPLKEDEKELLYILIRMPRKIEFNSNNYEMCKKIGRELDRIIKTENLVNEKKKINA